MDDETDGLGPDNVVTCAVCGRAIEMAPRGVGGAPGLGSGGLRDNRALCKSCESGRYRQKSKDIARRRR